MPFKFSKFSLKNLEGVNPKLVDAANQAIAISTVDFAITEGLRTLDRQKKLLADGFSKTLNSKHLTGEAIDVIALEAGKAKNIDIYYYICIADAFAKLSDTVKIKWGGSWRVLDKDIKVVAQYDNYLAGCAVSNKRPFVDGMHFELA